MAMAWITKIRNSTTESYTIYQNDPTWHPVINRHQYNRDEAINVPSMTPAGTRITFPPGLPWMPSEYIAPNDIVSVQDLEYCLIPWQQYGRLALISQKTGRKIEMQVGTFVMPDKDHLRGVFDDGTEVFTLELGPTGGAWWSVSYNFALIISPDQGMRFAIESVSKSSLPEIVAGLGDELKKVAPLILEHLLKAA